MLLYISFSIFLGTTTVFSVLVDFISLISLFANAKVLDDIIKQLNKIDNNFLFIEQLLPKSLCINFNTILILLFVTNS